MFSAQTSQHQGSGIVPGIAGMTAAAAVAWLTLPRHEALQGYPVISASVAHILLVVAANVLIVQVCGSVLGLNVGGVAYRSSAIAGWFAPLAAYLASGSRFGPLLAAVIGLKTARWIRSSLPPSTEKSRAGKVEFGLLPIPSRSRVRCLVASALGFDAMIACTAGGAVTLAAVFAMAAAAMAASQIFKSPPRTEPRLSGELVSSGLTWIVAFMLTARALGSGGGDGSRDRIFAANKGTYGGVFLWLPTPPNSPLPANPVRFSPLFEKGLSVRVKIPFDGVYWFFRPPQTRPPEESVVAYGNPHEARFRSTDSTPIIMEAHQRLSNPVELHGCGGIEVGVLNADNLPGRIELELVLSDSSERFNPPLSLGLKKLPALTLTSGFGWPIQKQTVTFAVPGFHQISSFNEITIRYYLDASRQTESAKVAIDYIVLVPTGG